MGSFDADTVFFHEYAHDLMLADLKAPMPAWLVEGFAEFMSTAKVTNNGSVALGIPANHRASNLLSDRAYQMPVADLVAAKVPRNSQERFSLYARGWLLSHYLTFAPERSGQLGHYLDEFAKGRPAIDAAQTAFGDLAALDKDLDRYLAKEKFAVLTLGADRLPIGPVDGRRSDPAARRRCRSTNASRRASPSSTTAGEAITARRIAAAHPGDPLVMMALAEAEWVADDFVAAEAAADRAIALMPKSAEALIWKGRAVQSRPRRRCPARASPTRGSFSAVPTGSIPKIPSLCSISTAVSALERARPTANAIAALHYAAELAPQDLDLSIELALQHLADGEGAKARPALVRAAQHPHGGERSAGEGADREHRRWQDRAQAARRRRQLAAKLVRLGAASAASRRRTHHGLTNCRREPRAPPAIFPPRSRTARR